MKKEFKLVLYILGFVLFLLVAGFGYRYLSEKYQAQNPLTENPTPTATASSASSPTQTAPESTTPPDNDDRIIAPDFTVYDKDGKQIKLSDFKGIPVVLNFWASWCPPCKSEMPDFNKVSQEYSSDQLQFLMIDLVDGQRETVASGQKYIDDMGFSFTVLFDTDQDAAMVYGVRSIPTTYFIDEEGYIVTGAEGAIEEDMLRKGISMIYKE